MLSDAATRWLAVGVLATLGAALLAWVVHQYRRRTYTLRQFPIYMFSLVITRVLWRAKVEGRVSIAAGQGAVIVCNHLGPVDPAFIALASGRQVHWMVAKEYVESPLYAWAFRALEVIPVNRGGIDTASTKTAVRYARQGDLVGLFPEGRINSSRTRFMLPGRPGAALIALRARVPVVPCYITGSPYDGTDYGFFFLSAKTRVKVGQPIDMAPYLAREHEPGILEDLTRRIMVEIAQLAGIPNYQPEIAGRNWRRAEIIEHD